MAACTNASTTSHSKVAVNNFTFPKKNQAIVIDAVDGIKDNEYIEAIAKRVGPQNIIAASRITQNRFCCYLISDTLADEITEEGKNVLKVAGANIVMRPYVAKLKPVIFSNVHPCVPHDVIICKLAEFGVTSKSSLSFMKVGIDTPGLTHILCFKRQIFLNPQDIEKIPTNFTITHEETPYRINVTTDKMVCFICKKEGHITESCPENNTQQSLRSQEQLDDFLELNTSSCLQAASSERDNSVGNNSTAGLPKGSSAHKETAENDEVNEPSKKPVEKSTSWSESSSSSSTTSSESDEDLENACDKTVKHLDSQPQLPAVLNSEYTVDLQNPPGNKRVKNTSVSSTESNPRKTPRTFEKDPSDGLSEKQPSRTVSDFDEELIKLYGYDEDRIKDFERLYKQLHPWKRVLDSDPDKFELSYFGCIELIVADREDTDIDSLLVDFNIDPDEAIETLESVFTVTTRDNKFLERRHLDRIARLCDKISCLSEEDTEMICTQDDAVNPTKNK